MATALQELRARLADIRANVDFVSRAATLRPRLGELLNWSLPGDALTPGRAFIDAKSARSEGLYGPLLVSILAAFERYTRQLIDFAVETRARTVSNYDHISQHVRYRNTALTGRLLSTIDSPRDHISVDYEQLAENLASCRKGAATFRLNAPAFTAVVTSASPQILERSLQNLDIGAWWDAIGKSTTLQKILGTKRVRETGEEVRSHLTDLWRRRNFIAHAGDEDVTLSDSNVFSAIDFIEALAVALDQEVKQRLK